VWWRQWCSTTDVGDLCGSIRMGMGTHLRHGGLGIEGGGRLLHEGKLYIDVASDILLGLSALERIPLFHRALSSIRDIA
jgi:hypothetical protein